MSAWTGQKVVRFTNDFTSQSTVMTSLSSPADIFYNIYTDTLAVPNSGNNTVVFQSFAPATNITVCNSVPLTLFSDSTSFGASDGFVTGTDSMIRCVIKNTSNYGFAYPQVKFNFIDPMPSGTTVETGSQDFIVIASSWNPGDVTPVKCYFHVTTPIPSGYQMRFTISVTNLPPANVDTCWFTDTLFLLMNVPNSICDCENFPTFNLFPNPAANNFSLKYDGTDASSLEIIDMTGRKLKEVKLISTAQEISIAEFSSGVYFISILNAAGKNIMNRRLVKE